MSERTCENCACHHCLKGLLLLARLTEAGGLPTQCWCVKLVFLNSRALPELFMKRDTPPYITTASGYIFANLLRMLAGFLLQQQGIQYCYLLQVGFQLPL